MIVDSKLGGETLWVFEQVRELKWPFWDAQFPGLRTGGFQGSPLHAGSMATFDSPADYHSWDAQFPGLRTGIFQCSPSHAGSLSTFASPADYHSNRQLLSDSSLF